MRTSKTLIAASLAIAIVSVPIVALAGGRHHGGHGGRPHHGVVRHQGPSHHVRGVNLPGYRFGPYAPYYGYRYPYYAGKFYGGGYGYFGGYGGYYGGGSYGGITYYAPPADYTPSTTIYAPTIMYPPAASYGYAPAPSYSSVALTPAAPPPRPTVIEYTTGRYELRGDGMSMPYTWVWIPNPPPPPEVEPEPVPQYAPPAPQSAPPRASADRAPRKSQLYRWVDAQGVVHLTDNPENVPEDQRTPARRPF